MRQAGLDTPYRTSLTSYGTGLAQEGPSTLDPLDSSESLSYHDRQVLIVKPLHQEGHPCQSAFNPQRLELGEPFGNPVQDPVRHMDHVAPHESQCVHAEKPVDGRKRWVLPMIAGMEGQRLAGRLDH